MSDPTGERPDDATIGSLRELGDLHDRGVLTDTEFAAQKSRLLGL